MPDFVHLNVHSQYSLLEAACRTKDLCAITAEQGASALALTDFGNLFGAIEFYKTCQKAGIKPIIGCTIFLKPPKRRPTSQRDSGPVDPARLVLLAKDGTGYANLLKIVTRSHLKPVEGVERPVIDYATLAPLCTGLIGLSAGEHGSVGRAILKGTPADVDKVIAKQKSLFAEGDYFLELQDHGTEKQKKLNKATIDYARKHGLPLVATNDVHYVEREHARAHDVLCCIRNGEQLANEMRRAFPSEEYYLKSPEQMTELFADMPEAIANTVAIAERCNVEIELGVNKFPRYKCPDGLTARDYLRQLCEEGMVKRFGNRANDKELRDRLELEFGVIANTGFIDYFIITWDFINFARRSGIPVGPGRGSAAGSLIAYVLEITDIDPLEYKLFFERFLNPERVSPPDVDIDFCYNRRSEVIEYTRKKYGDDTVAQIITFGTLGAKSVIKDVGRVLGMSYGDTDRIAKLIPFDPKMTLAKALEVPEFKELVEADDEVRELVELAQTLEGLGRNTGVHAAGVVIGEGRLEDSMPLTRDEDGGTVTQWAMDPLTDVGALKMDFLGLKTLTVIVDCLKLVKATTGTEIEQSRIPLNDKKTYRLLQRARNVGLFQLESEGMCKLCRGLKPSNIEDIIALVALYRPGPMENIPAYEARKLGRVEIEYAHPLLEPICKDTYGVMIYQEQVMQAANVLAGYSLGGADMLRRAMGKKKIEVMQEERKKFVKGCKELNDIGSEQANALFDTLEKFAGYGFNKAHSACYGVLAYQTAWLKANYPVQFMASLMSNDMDNNDKIAMFVNEAKVLGIELRPPDVNRSYDIFTVEPAEEGEHEYAIRFSLAAIKNVGRHAVEEMCKVRQDEGAFADLDDLCTRVGPRSLPRKTVESLVKAGAMDGFGSNRKVLFGQIENALANASAVQRDRDAGQGSLLDMMGGLDQPANGNGHNGNGHRVAEESANGHGSHANRRRGQAPEREGQPDWELLERLEYEKELLGFYISGHPVENYLGELAGLQMSRIGDLTDKRGPRDTRIAGIVTQVNVRTSQKDGRPWAAFRIEDQTGAIEALCFQDNYAKLTHIPQKGEPAVIAGAVDRREEFPKIKAEEVLTLAEARESLYLALKIRVRTSDWAHEDLMELRDLITDFPGTLTVYLLCENDAGHVAELILPDNLRVDFNEAFIERLDEFLGRSPDGEPPYQILASQALPERRRWKKPAPSGA